MFDAMQGAYDLDAIEERYHTHHIFLMWLHIYIANIFLLNYLVAILSTVYEEMLETGDFSYKVKKY